MCRRGSFLVRSRSSRSGSLQARATQQHFRLAFLYRESMHLYTVTRKCETHSMSTANPIHSRLHCKINARITHFMLMYSLFSHSPPRAVLTLLPRHARQARHVRKHVQCECVDTVQLIRCEQYFGRLSRNFQSCVSDSSRRGRYTLS